MRVAVLLHTSEVLCICSRTSKVKVLHGEVSFMLLPLINVYFVNSFQHFSLDFFQKKTYPALENILGVCMFLFLFSFHNLSVNFKPHWIPALFYFCVLLSLKGHFDALTERCPYPAWGNLRGATHASHALHSAAVSWCFKGSPSVSQAHRGLPAAGFCLPSPIGIHLSVFDLLFCAVVLQQFWATKVSERFWDQR